MRDWPCASTPTASTLTATCRAAWQAGDSRACHDASRCHGRSDDAWVISSSPPRQAELRFHGVEAQDIAVDHRRQRERGLELRTVEIGRVGAARMGVSGLLRFPRQGIAGSIDALVDARDPRGLLRLLGVFGRKARQSPPGLRRWDRSMCASSPKPAPRSASPLRQWCSPALPAGPARQSRAGSTASRPSGKRERSSLPARSTPAQAPLWRRSPALSWRPGRTVDRPDAAS
jgi:hypothetical protein